MKREISRVMAGILFAISSLSLSGCLVNRLHTVQNQFCDFDENFSVSVDGGMSIAFLNPVLFYDDVVFLAGLAPQLENLGGDRYRASYLIRRDDGREGVEIPVIFAFEKQDHELRLTRVSVQSPLLSAFHPAKFPQVIDDACNMNLSFSRARIELPTPYFDRTLIPTREQLIQMAGKPTQLSHDGNELQYQFVLQGANNDEMTGSINLLYGDSGDTLLRTRTRFYHYSSGADFEHGMAWAKITL